MLQRISRLPMSPARRESGQQRGSNQPPFPAMQLSDSISQAANRERQLDCQKEQILPESPYGRRPTTFSSSFVASGSHVPHASETLGAVPASPAAVTGHGVSAHFLPSTFAISPASSPSYQARHYNQWSAPVADSCSYSSEVRCLRSACICVVPCGACKVKTEADLHAGPGCGSEGIPKRAGEQPDNAIANHRKQRK